MSFLLHPLGYCPHGVTYVACRGYNFWSGIEGNAPIIGSVVVLLLTAWRLLHHHFECHAEGCSRIGLHHVENTHFRTCWKDHPVLGQHPHHKVPLDAIHQHWRDGQVDAQPPDR